MKTITRYSTVEDKFTDRRGEVILLSKIVPGGCWVSYNGDVECDHASTLEVLKWGNGSPNLVRKVADQTERLHKMRQGFIRLMAALSDRHTVCLNKPLMFQAESGGCGDRPLTLWEKIRRWLWG